MTGGVGDPPRKAAAVPSSRLSRLSRLGGLTAGVAGTMALNGAAQLGMGKRPTMRGLLLTPANIARITEQLAQMRGAAMKIGQILSMDSGDVLPPELAAILARLRADAYIMPPRQLKAALDGAWPAGWLGQFAQFDVRPLAAASIGQVHRAQTRDGRDLAIKVQYPGVAASIDSDVANVGALIRVSGLVPKGFALGPYLDEARAQLHAETDYLGEAQNLAQFGQLLAGDARFVLPDLAADWTRPSILAMSYLPGRPIEAAAEADQPTRDALAEALLDLTLRELFQFGLMQTDPNFANYRWQPETGRIVLLDFGATRALDPAIVALYRDLLNAGLAGDAPGLEAAALGLGLWDATTAAPHRAQLMAMLRAVFAALTGADRFAFAQTDLTARLQDQGLALAQSGFIPPPVPMDVLHLQRKFAGMFLLAARLRARVPLTALLARHGLGPRAEKGMVGPAGLEPATKAL